MKVKQKLISLILSLTLTMGLATAPAFASDLDTSYFINSVARNWTGASGVHSIYNDTKLGNLVATGIQYLSLDLDAIDTSLYQIYSSLSYLSTINTNTNNLYTILNSLTSRWYAADSSFNPPQGHDTSWFYRVLQALGDIKTINNNEYSGLSGHLGTISSKLDAWTGTDTLDIADIVYDIYKNNENNLDFFEDVLSGGAITSNWHWNDNGTWREVASNTIPVINRNSDGQLYLNVYPYESSNLSIKGLLQAMIRNQFYETTAIRGTYENNRFLEYTSSGAIQGDLSDNVIKSIQLLNNNIVSSNVDLYTLLNSPGSKFLFSYPVYNENSKSISMKASNTPQIIDYTTEYGNYVSTIKSRNVNNFVDYLGVVNNNIVGVFNSIITLGHSYDKYYYDEINTTVEAIQGSSDKAYSIMDYAEHIDYELNDYLGRLSYILADPQSIQAKKDNAAQTSSVLDNFTGSGSASASASDFAGVKDSVSALKTSLSGGASYTQAFNILGGDSDGWSWFSQEVADSMDSTNSTRGMLRGDISSSTPYLDSYYDSIYSVIGLGGDIE